jgi:hypothetical protein
VSIGWLKEVASLNIKSVIVMADVSHVSIGWLKEVASSNI